MSFAPNLASALQAFLTMQNGRAGASAPTLQKLQVPTANYAPPTISTGAGAGPIDYSGLTSFYSNPGNSDYTSDPVLLQAEAQDKTAVQNAESSALKGREQLLAQYGDPGLAAKVLGMDDPTLGAVSADPNTSTSILARLGRSYNTTVQNNEDQRNKANLWYSSNRAEGLANDARDYTTGQADAAATAQSGLDAISAALANAKSGASQSDRDAMAAAYQRYLAAVTARPPTSIPRIPGVNDKVPDPSLPDFTNPLLTGNETPTDLQAGVGTPDANGVYPASNELPVAIGSGVHAKSATSNQGVFANDLGNMDYPTSPLKQFLQPPVPSSGAAGVTPSNKKNSQALARAY